MSSRPALAGSLSSHKVFRDGGGHLPDDWKVFSRVMNTVTAALSLSRADTREGFIPELCEIVISGLAA